MYPENQQKDCVSNSPGDDKLWKAFKAGSEEAFTTIYNNFIYELYHYGERLTNNNEIIEDCIQDLFIELWKNKATIANVTNIKFYLFKGLKRKIVKKLQKDRKLPTDSLPEEYDFEVKLSPESLHITEYSSQEQQTILRKKVNELTPRQKEAITLKFYDGLSYHEVSVILNMTTRATYNLIYRAIDVLKANIDKLPFLLLMARLLV